MDLISRQEAIEALEEPCKVPDTWTDEYAVGERMQWEKDVKALNSLPSAEPERPFKIQDILYYLDTALHPIVSPEHWNVYSELHDMISTLPSAQPEIIRCKDCKHYQFADNRAFGYPVKRCEWTGFEDVDDDDFCSRGERKDG